MNEVLVDTNCILSFLIQRDEVQHRKMIQFWNEVSNLSIQAVIIPHTVSEVVFVLQSIYSMKSSKINEILKDLHTNPGVRIKESFNINTILGIWPNQVKDYGDAILAGTGLELLIPIATFDKKFIAECKKLGLKTYMF